MATPLTLKVFRGDELIRSENFTRDIIKIGRLSSAHLCLEDERVSRIHSVIEIAPDGNISIIDMGSAEGTYVNGKRVNKGPLKLGDEITLGGLRILLEANAVVNAAAPVAAVHGNGAAAAAAPAPEAAQADAPLAQTVVGPAPESPAAAPPPAPEPEQQAAPPAAEPTEQELPAPKPAPRARPAARVAPRAAAPADDGDEDERRPRRRPARDEDESRGGDWGVELRMLWGETLLDAGTFVKPDRAVRVGTGEKVDFTLSGPDLPLEEFPILRYANGEYQFAFGRKMTGALEEEGEATSLTELVKARKASADGEIDGAYTVAVPRKGLVWADFGTGVRMEARYKKPPKPALVPWYETLNYQFLNLFLVVFFAFAGFMVAAANFPFDTDTVQDDLFKNPSRMAKFVIKPAEQQKKNPYLDQLEKKLKKDDPGEMAAKHKGTEGQMGKREAAKTNGRSAPKAIDPNDKEMVKNTGILKLLGRGGGGLSTIFGQGGLGGDLKGAIGNMFGPVVGDSHGLGGLGLKGSGSGGGGVGDTIGIGAVGTKGRGGGLGGYGTGVGGLGKKSDRDVNISSGTPVVMGSLDKELIRRVIKAHEAQIRYCYEQQLAVNPKLEGKVSVRWIITASGMVSNAQIDSGGTTLNDGTVHSCMTSRIGSWEFPKPKGGGIVVVTYPWILRASGGSGG